MNDLIKIGNTWVGKNQPVFIIAELSANHNQQLDIAIETIKAAKRSGANAIKLQTYTPDTITLNSKRSEFKLTQGTIWDGQYLYDLYKQAYTPWDWHKKLFDVAKEEGLEVFSSPFDFSAVDFLETFHPPAYKIASFEINDIPLIRKVARLNKPIIISTGVATIEDIELALKTCRDEGNEQIILLKCTSSYPAPIKEANLVMIRDLADRFMVIPGLSDHTLGITVPIVATALGTCVIEKHFILDRTVGGPDASFSLDEKEFTAMVKAVREAEKAIGKVDYSLSEKQLSSKEHSRSLFICADIKKGEKFTEENIRSVRPAFGLHPKYYYQVLGKTATEDLNFGEPLKVQHIQGFIE
jgi:pseudaminic acid synthase